MKITLGNGKCALVDKDDYEKVNQYQWHARQKNRVWYAYRWLVLPNGKSKFIQMHRYIMNPSSKMEIDHINHDGLDNRRDNLRTCTHRDNIRNQRIRYSKSNSPYKGVSWREYCKSWRAYITINGKTKHLGYFKDARNAALTYDTEAKKHFGDFACCNF